MAASRTNGWKGPRAFAPTRSIQAIADFLSHIVHIHVEAEIFHELGSAESARVLLTVLLDLCLLAKADWPADPKQNIADLWEKLADERGADHLVHKGAALQFTDS
jgi:hypothetical protein